MKRTALDFGNEFQPGVSKIVCDNFYVDDCLCSVSSVDAGLTVLDQLPKLLQRGGFHLTKWLTNNYELQQAIPDSERLPTPEPLIFGGPLFGRVLGMSWDVVDDQFKFDVNLPAKPLTRRGILSALSSLYDPLGFLSPVILLPKILLQSLCKQGLGWDDTISQFEAEQWTKWLNSLHLLRSFKIDRCLKPAEFGQVATSELHHFSDASMKAYGSCSYIRLTDESGNVVCAFLMSKSRLTPIQAMSIPRLELSAAVLSVRLDIFLRRELHLQDCVSTFWSDSTAVLQIIRNPRKRFPVFVANRVSVIEWHSDSCDWRHVPTQLNPADAITRSLTTQTFLDCFDWRLSGPEFLWLSSGQWPQIPLLPVELPLDLTHSRPDISVKACSAVKTVSPTDKFINYFSSLYRLKKSAAWVLRCCMMAKTKNYKINLSRLSVDELQGAENQLIKYVQAREFSHIISCLSRKVPIKDKFSRPLLKLSPILVNGILRVGGRLDRAPIDYDVRHPIILPNNSHFTELLIQLHHHLVGHSGMGHIWSSIRQNYWIIKGGAAVRHVIGKRVPCRKRNSSVSQQLMADLPSGRLQIEEPPFSHVGVDYFGPLVVRRGRTDVKRYGCIFTCLTIRAVHIEIAHSLNTDSFINALRRFICRRGTPQHIYSDNGTNFVGANKILGESLRLWNQVQIDDYLRQREIRWSFNPPSASHMGGA